MDALECARIACAVLGGTCVLFAELVIYIERTRHAKQPWWQDGTHDEVRTYHDGGE